MTGPVILSSDALRILPAAGSRIAAMRGTVGAALLFSAAAHAGALYWAVSEMQPQEISMSAGAAVSIEVVLVQGPGEPSARAASAPEGAEEDAEKAADRAQESPFEAPAQAADRAVSGDSHPAAPPPEDVVPPAPTSVVPAETADSSAPHPAPEAPAAAPPDPVPEVAVAAPPPPAPRPSPPARVAGAHDPTTQIAHAGATAPAPVAAAASTGTAGAPEQADNSDGKQAAAPRADNPAPAYPYAARLRGQQGRVLLRVEVLPSGEAGAVAVAQSSGYESLDRAARQAVQRWRFHPALRNGEPVAASVQVPIRFAFR